ncbi:MAG: hypothetical protein HEQ22_02640 [Sphingopyxis sp.]|uniref:hypothetical protein n=1 Tax=Sphingopyxis sp. TaxID=1908224 RepID=UPI003D80E867
MNLAPSDLPRLAGAASLSKPGFDIISAVSGARQAALPTAHLLRERANRRAHLVTLKMLRAMMSGAVVDRPQDATIPVRFLNLSDTATGSPETMNSLFTRGFQPMLNPLHIDPSSSAHPLAGEAME